MVQQFGLREHPRPQPVGRPRPQHLMPPESTWEHGEMRKRKKENNATNDEPCYLESFCNNILRDSAIWDDFVMIHQLRFSTDKQSSVLSRTFKTRSVLLARDIIDVIKVFSVKCDFRFKVEHFATIGLHCDE
jgi:hypothetical protein